MDRRHQRDAQMRRSPLKAGDTSPWLDYLRAKGAKIAIVPGVGHFTQIEAADEVNRLIENLVAARR